MKIILSLVLGGLLCFGQAAAGEIKDTKGSAKADKVKSSYSLGYEIGSGMKRDAIEIDPDGYIKGFREGLAGSPSALTEQERRTALLPLQMKAAEKDTQRKRKLADERQALSEKNRKESEAFLAENAKKKDIVIRPSGLQYKVVRDGTGKQPARTDKVKVHYRGILINGAEFDSSYKRDAPAVFGLDKVIAGWTEALQLMKEGAKWTLYVPAHLAYGDRIIPNGSIGPNQTLIFEVELIAIEK